MFRNWWDYRAATNQERATRLKADIGRLDTQMVKLVDKMIDSENALVTAQLEKRLAQLEKDKQIKAEKVEKLSKPVRGYGELFEPALMFLANPYKIWRNGTYEDRRIVLKLAFTERLRYSRKSGLRTPKTSIPFKALGTFSTSKNGMAHRGCVALVL